MTVRLNRDYMALEVMVKGIEAKAVPALSFQ